jgi:hypothetical protein
VEFLGRMGGIIPTPEEVLEKITAMANAPPSPDFDFRAHLGTMLEH